MVEGTMKTLVRSALVGALLLITDSPTFACTVFLAFDGRSALAGSNEDPNTQVWFVPATKDSYGMVYFGFGRGEYPRGGIATRLLKIPEGGITKINPEDLYGIPQGGMNEKGLFFDGASTDVVKVASATSKKTYDGRLEDLILRKCATVKEALKHFRFAQGQWLFADKTGDSFTIEAGEVIILKKGSYQVMTNFLQSQVRPDEVTCPRHQFASKTLAGEKALSVDLVGWLLKATSIKSTQYSTIFHLGEGGVHLSPGELRAGR